MKRTVYKYQHNCNAGQNLWHPSSKGQCCSRSMLQSRFWSLHSAKSPQTCESLMLDDSSCHSWCSRFMSIQREWSNYMYGPYGPYGLYGPLRALRALTDRTGPLRAPYGHSGTYGPLATVQKLTSHEYYRVFSVHVEVISLFLPLLDVEIRHRQELKIVTWTTSTLHSFESKKIR